MRGHLGVVPATYPSSGASLSMRRLTSVIAPSRRWQHRCHAKMGPLNAKERTVGKVVMYSSVSVDGFIADEHDQPGPLFDWLSSGDVALDDSGMLHVSQASCDYVQPYWD